MAPKKNTTVKKKKYPKIASGLIKIRTTNNNTIMNFTDNNGNTIMVGGTWSVGFKWTKESSAYAAEVLAKKILTEAKNSCGLKEIWVVMKGTGLGREGFFKAINEVGGIEIMYITENTAIQFGGVKGIRPKRN